MQTEYPPLETSYDGRLPFGGIAFMNKAQLYAVDSHALDLREGGGGRSGAGSGSDDRDLGLHHGSLSGLGHGMAGEEAVWQKGHAEGAYTFAGEGGRREGEDGGIDGGRSGTTR